LDSLIRIAERIDFGNLPALYRGQFLQVLLNLINNSIQILSISTPAQKLISLRGYHDQTQYHLEISDTGPGVALDLQSILFELFSSNKSSGMGVGLWLCAYIMRNAGGKITYQDAPGGGAKFMLSFPMAPEKI
jgi:C4-dicarboxylate-specific signal transduction histidine kinase